MYWKRKELFEVVSDYVKCSGARSSINHERYLDSSIPLN
jgi:hypothetical protein